MTEARVREDLRIEAEKKGVTRLPRGPIQVVRTLMAAAVMTSALSPGHAFTAYDCNNQSNRIDFYSLMEPEACPSSDGNVEIERTVYGEIVQMTQDRIIPIFRCQVMESVMSQYCGHFSAAGVARYVRFREPKTVEAW